MAILQDQIGGFYALGDVLSVALDDSVQLDRMNIVEKLSDAGRHLADLHHAKSETRRWLLSTNLNQKYKDAVNEGSMDGWLFGGGLSDRLQSAKSLEKSTVELKAPKKASEKKNLNFRPPLKYQTPTGRKNVKKGSRYHELSQENGGSYNRSKGSYSSNNRNNYQSRNAIQSKSNRRRPSKSPRRH